MQMLSGVVLGPRPIEADSDLKGMIIGTATVKSGVRLLIKGVVTGDLVMEPGSYADVQGVVIGTVRNNGGVLNVDGIVGGLEDTTVDAAAAPGASYGQRRLAS
jgi:hypothetical protein